MHKTYAGDQAEDSSPKQPQQLALSRLLPVLDAGHALEVKVIEARGIVLQLDKETLAEKSKLPALSGVFDPIHLGLAKSAKLDEYGGGMSPRLEFIEKNLAKSLQDLAKLPSACDASHQAQWKAASASLQLLLKTVTQAKQARAQATWTAKESDKLIQAALPRLRGANDKASVQELESYNKKLQEGLWATAKALGKGLAGKNLDKKVMPKLEAKCGSVLAMRLPTRKEAGMLLAGVNAGGGLTASKPALPLASGSSATSKPNPAKEAPASQTAGGKGSDSPGKTDPAKPLVAPAAAPPGGAGAPTPEQCASLESLLASECSQMRGFDQSIRQSTNDDERNYYKRLKALLQVDIDALKLKMEGCSGATDCEETTKLCPDGKTREDKGQCACPEGQALSKDGKRCEKPCSQRGISIKGPADLILFKPSANSPLQSFKAVTIEGSATTVQWSASSNKIVLQGRTDQPTVNIRPSLESGRESDVTIAVNMDGCSGQRKLTVRRPKTLSHPQPLKFKLDDKGWAAGAGTDGNFLWTLVDQLGKPMPNILVKEEVRKAADSSIWALWSINPWHKIETEKPTDTAGQVEDKYFIPTFFPFQFGRKGFSFHLQQKLDANGFVGYSGIEITLTNVTGTSPVDLK